MKINIENFYNSRLEQIDYELKKEFYKGKRKNSLKIAKLYEEKNDLKSRLK